MRLTQVRQVRQVRQVVDCRAFWTAEKFSNCAEAPETLEDPSLWCISAWNDFGFKVPNKTPGYDGIDETNIWNSQEKTILHDNNDIR